MQHAYKNLLKYVFKQIFIAKQKKIKMGNYRNMFILLITLFVLKWLWAILFGLYYKYKDSTQ